MRSLRSRREDRRPGRAALALLAVAIVLAPGRSTAFELKLWPLLDLESRGDETRIGALGPLVEWRRAAEETFFAVRPLYYAVHRRTSAARRGAALYPLAWWERNEQSYFFRSLGLLTYERERRPLGVSSWTSRFQIFPFVFYRRAPEAGTELSVLPLYANVTDFFGYRRIRMILFPLYLKLEEPLFERTWLPFPFYSWVGGAIGRGTRLWPFWGHTLRGGESETEYVGWPFYVRRVEHPGREDRTTTRISWPFFSVIEGPRLVSRSYAFLLVIPLYTHTVDARTDTEILGFPWPFWIEQWERKTGRRQSLRLTPLYEERTTAAMRSTFYLWPFYRHKVGLGDVRYERTDSLLVLYRDERQGEGANASSTFALFPVWVDKRSAGGGHAQLLALVDAIFPANEKIRELYAPLYRLYGCDTTAGETRRDVLWKMWEWGGGKLRPPWYFSSS